MFIRHSCCFWSHNKLFFFSVFDVYTAQSNVTLFSFVSLFSPSRAQSMAANVDDISRSRGFKKIISGLREKEKNFVNHGSDGVR